MTEVVTGSSSQALESAQFLPDSPLTQQHISSYSFTPAQLICPHLSPPHKASQRLCSGEKVVSIHLRNKTSSSRHDVVRIFL